VPDSVRPESAAAPPAADPPPVGGRSLKEAVVTAVALVLIVGACSVAGPGAFFVLVCVVVTLATFEAVDALIQAGRKPSMGLALAGEITMLVAAYGEKPALIAAVLAIVMYGAFLFALRSDRGPTPMSDAACTLLVVTWIGGGGAGAASVLTLGLEGVSLMLAFIVIVALDDVAAYFVGRRFGRRRLASSISPAKSWEGAWGGAIAALAAGVATAPFTGALSLLQGLGLGALCALLSPIGDLVESLFKRELSIKDSGRLLPGHGGFLDRLDALIFSAPAVFLYLRFVVYS
jgi:phosphatidate cytidylyltransferase